MSRSDSAAKSLSARVVFPVEPQGAGFIRRLVLIVPALAVGLAGAAYMRASAPPLDLHATLVRAVAPASEPATEAASAAPPAVASHPRTDSARVPHRTPPAASAPPRRQELVAAPVIAPIALPVQQPEEIGAISVSATPWGKVSVDGAVLGTTPVVNLALPAGDHRVRIEREGFETFDRLVNVPSGGTLRLTGITLKRRFR